jgi:hypothetical protein
MAKRLTIAEMRKEDTKKFNVRREITVNDHPILIDNVFRESKTRQVLIELVRDMDYLKKQGVAIDGMDVTAYTSLLIIKHFTDVEVPEKVEEKLVVMNMLIDLGYFRPLMDAMDPEQIDKINDSMNDILNNLDERMALIKANEGKFEAIFADKDFTGQAQSVDKVDDPEGE